MTDWLDDRSKVEKRLHGAVKSGVIAHGDADPAALAAAIAKRVYGELKALRREFNEKSEKEKL